MAVGRRWAAALICAVTVLGPMVAGPAQPAHAASTPDYLSASDAATYTVGDDGVVHVVLDQEITNTEPPPAGGGYYYFSYFTVPVLHGAAHGVVTVDGAPQTVSFTGQDRNFDVARVDLHPVIKSEQTRHVVLSYDIEPGDPRAQTFVQDNAAFASFIAYAPGDPMRTSVTVVVPDRFQADVAGSTMQENDNDVTTTYTASGIADPLTWSASVTVHDDDRLVRRRVDVHGDSVQVQAWPNDAGWTSFVASQLQTGVPVLERLIGSSLPVPGTLTITETATPYAHGYSGDYTRDTNTIEIGNELDPVVILHETSHEWFNERHFYERWINEGLAQELSTRAAQAEGKPLQKPTRPDEGSDVAVHLVDWVQPGAVDPKAQQKEQWGYNASFYVMRSIEQEIGPARMRAALQNALSGHAAFGVEPGKFDKYDGTLGWQRLLDDFDVIGGSHDADALFEKYVVESSNDAAVALHAVLRRHYAAIATRAGDWGVPLAMRQTIEQWDDSNTPSVQRTTGKILDERDHLQRQLDAVHLALPVSLRSAYQHADVAHLDGVLTTLRHYQSTVDALVHAESVVRVHHSIVTWLGLLGEHPRASLTSAEAALRRGDAHIATQDAAAATNTVHHAPWRALIGFGMGLGIVLALGLLLLALRAWRRRARRRRWRAPLTRPPPPDATPAPEPATATATADATEPATTATDE